MERFKHHWHKAPRPARRVIVTIVGGVFILAGIVMLVTPGPGWAAIFLGLAVLATEFERAERIKSNIHERFKNAIDKARKAVKR
jgi:uncharacterized protein (TIGR02611 family)